VNKKDGRVWVDRIWDGTSLTSQSKHHVRWMNFYIPLFLTLVCDKFLLHFFIFFELRPMKTPSCRWCILSNFPTSVSSTLYQTWLEKFLLSAEYENFSGNPSCAFQYSPSFVLFLQLERNKKEFWVEGISALVTSMDSFQE